MKVMISQPMNGRSMNSIKLERGKAIKEIEARGDTFVNTYFTNVVAPYKIAHPPLWYLAKSLQIMAECDAVYFCEGWENARGCKIERQAAEAYGLVIYESFNPVNDIQKEYEKTQAFFEYEKEGEETLDYADNEE